MRQHHVVVIGIVAIVDIVSTSSVGNNRIMIDPTTVTSSPNTVESPIIDASSSAFALTKNLASLTMVGSLNASRV